MVRKAAPISSAKAYWKLLAVAACWGASWLAGRVVAQQQVDALVAASLRFIFGSAGLLAVLAITRNFVKPPNASLAPMLLMGASGIFLYNLCFFVGLKFIPAGRASLLAATQPGLIFVMMAITGRERPSLVRVLGLLASLTGASIVLAQGDPRKLFQGGASKGDFVILGCVAAWVTYTLAGRWAMKHLAPLPVAAYSTFIGTAMLLAGSAAMSGAKVPALDRLPPSAWAAVAFLGLAGTTLAFVWYMDGVREIGPARASIFINLVPVFGVLFSVLFLGETLTRYTAGGGLLVLLGVRLLNRPA